MADWYGVCVMLFGVLLLAGLNECGLAEVLEGGLSDDALLFAAAAAAADEDKSDDALKWWPYVFGLY